MSLWAPPKYQINLIPTFGSGLLSCSSYLKPLGAEMKYPFETSDVTILDSYSGVDNGLVGYLLSGQVA